MKMEKFLDENYFENDYSSLICRINVLEDSVKLLSDSELKNQTQILKKTFKKTNKLKNIIAKSFALVREASRRKTGLIKITLSASVIIILIAVSYTHLTLPTILLV